MRIIMTTFALLAVAGASAQARAQTPTADDQISALQGMLNDSVNREIASRIGQTATGRALAAEIAVAADLRRQIDELTAKLKAADATVAELKAKTSPEAPK
jgi:hypothetical protein